MSVLERQRKISSLKRKLSCNVEITYEGDISIDEDISYLGISMHLESPLSWSGDREILKGESGRSGKEVSIDVPCTMPRDRATIFCISEDIEMSIWNRSKVLEISIEKEYGSSCYLPFIEYVSYNRKWCLNQKTSSFMDMKSLFCMKGISLRRSMKMDKGTWKDIYIFCRDIWFIEMKVMDRIRRWCTARFSIEDESIEWSRDGEDTDISSCLEEGIISWKCCRSIIESKTSTNSMSVLERQRKISSLKRKLSCNVEITYEGDISIDEDILYLGVSVHLERPLSRSGDREILKGERGISREEISIDVQCAKCDTSFILDISKYIDSKAIPKKRISGKDTESSKWYGSIESDSTINLDYIGCGRDPPFDPGISIWPVSSSCDRVDRGSESVYRSDREYIGWKTHSQKNQGQENRSWRFPVILEEVYHRKNIEKVRVAYYKETIL